MPFDLDLALKTALLGVLIALFKGAASARLTGEPISSDECA